MPISSPLTKLPVPAEIQTNDNATTKDCSVCCTSKFVVSAGFDNFYAEWRQFEQKVGRFAGVSK